MQLDRFEHVGLHIGMMDLEKVIVSLQTKFWPLCHAIHEQLQQGLADDKPMHYLRAEPLCEHDAEVQARFKQYHGRVNDFNLSNIGPYPFRHEFEGCKLKHYHCVGSNACPAYGTIILLVCSIKCLDYSLLHVAEGQNGVIAKNWLHKLTSLVETAWQYDGEWTFDHFMKQSNT
jgi:hypothetical protein